MMIMVAATLVLASCSKESKLNRKLDGSWNVVSYSVNGADQPFGTSTMVMEFVKDKKGVGTYTQTSTTSSGSSVSTGTYVLTDDTKLTISQLTPTVETADQFVVTDYSKSDLTLTMSDALLTIVYKLKKK